MYVVYNILLGNQVNNCYRYEIKLYTNSYSIQNKIDSRLFLIYYVLNVDNSSIEINTDFV